MTSLLPMVAIVGPPNVGKSTLFNRLSRSRKAMVQNKPGVTRDRIFREVNLEGYDCILVDTGGLISESKITLHKNVLEQTQLAIEEADLILFVLDGQRGLEPGNEEIAHKLRVAGKPVVILVNKIDLPQHDDRLYDFYALGFEQILPISADHNRNVGQLLELIEKYLGELTTSTKNQLETESQNTKQATPELDLKFSLVGRPNVGKSSLANRLLGEKRFVVDSTAGTTRDSVDAKLIYEEKSFTLIDTAGIRRKRSIAESLEHFSVLAAVRSIDRSDIAVLVLDATQVMADQDAKIAALALERGCGLVLVLNKWDLVFKSEASENFQTNIYHDFPFLKFASILRISAKTGLGLKRLFPELLKVQQNRSRRISTGQLNQFFKQVVLRRAPPIKRGRRPRLFFVSQPQICPPTFVFTASHPTYVRASYESFLKNALRERYDFSGTPIWIKFRARNHKRKSRK